jgi:hypothetical protein
VRGVVAGALVLLMAIGSLAMWTAIPIGWIWIASLLSSTGYVIYLIALLGAPPTIAFDAWILRRLNDAYVRLRGYEERRSQLLDVLLVGSVILALAGFLFWYFGLAGIPSGTPWPDEVSGQ